MKEITIEVEINRCLLSTIILVISETDFSNSTNADFFRQRLKTIIEKQTDFFTLLLTKQQCELITTRLIIASDIDPLINSLQTNVNEKNFSNLIDFIEKKLTDKNDFPKLINFLLSTFDQKCLSIEQMIQLYLVLMMPSKKKTKSRT